MTTIYECEKFPGLMTYGTDGELIRFHAGQFVATRKSQRDVLDNMKHVDKKEVAQKSAPAPKATPKRRQAPAKSATKATK